MFAVYTSQMFQYTPFTETLCHSGTLAIAKSSRQLNWYGQTIQQRNGFSDLFKGA